jgi:hypothetical protein
VGETNESRHTGLVHNGGICTGETYKVTVKLTSFKGASLEDSFWSVRLERGREGPLCHRHRGG